MPESKAEKPEVKNKEGPAEHESPREEAIEWIFTVKAQTGEVIKIEHTKAGQAQRSEISLADYATAMNQQAEEQAQQAHEQVQQQYAAMAYGLDPYSMSYAYPYPSYGPGYSPYWYNPYSY